MSLCHPVPLPTNESRCPKVGWKWLATDIQTSQHQTDHAMRVDDPQRTMSLLKVTLAVVAILVICKALYTWFHKQRLRYLLRLSFVVLFVSSSLNVVCRHHPCDACHHTDLHRSWTTTVSVVIAIVMLVVRYHWAIPHNIVKSQLSVGFSHLKAPAKDRLKKVQNLARERMSLAYPGQVPPVYPNGWIPIVESNDVKLGQVVSVTAIGQKFCVFRGETGRAYVLDAYCPHLGADLSAGGRVRGDCVECPFHGWEFAGKDGACTTIPYADKVPDVARAKTWPSREVNAFIFVWHHAEGEEPSWEMPPIEEVMAGKWKFRGRTAHEVHCHIQEIPENGADVAHLHQVHSRSILMGSRWMDCGSWLLDFVHHQWKPVWEADQKRSHIGKIQLSQRIQFMGMHLPFSTLILDIEQIGPACVHLHMQTSFGKGVLLQHIIPEGPLTQRVVHFFYTEPAFKQFPADLIVQGEAIMLERDIAVWNNKMFLRRPVLVKEDHLISRYRRWYSQFYSENSPTLQSIREKTLDW